jgi:hypothetical protein
MINSLKSWLGQVTTGHGFMILAGTLLSVMSGAITWAGAAPLLAAGVVGLVWPENSGLQTAAQTTATDIAGLVNAYTNKGAAAAAGAKPPV